MQCKPTLCSLLLQMIQFFFNSLLWLTEFRSKILLHNWLNEKKGPAESVQKWAIWRAVFFYPILGRITWGPNLHFSSRFLTWPPRTLSRDPKTSFPVIVTHLNEEKMAQGPKKRDFTMGSFHRLADTDFFMMYYWILAKNIMKYSQRNHSFLFILSPGAELWDEIKKSDCKSH